jgi:hypothetical protein
MTSTDGEIRRTCRTQTRKLARADRVVFDTDGRRFAEQSGCRMATSTKNARREEHFDVDGLGRLG